MHRSVATRFPLSLLAWPFSYVNLVMFCKWCMPIKNGLQVLKQEVQAFWLGDRSWCKKVKSFSLLRLPYGMFSNVKPLRCIPDFHTKCGSNMDVLYSSLEMNRRHAFISIQMGSATSLLLVRIYRIHNAEWLLAKLPLTITCDITSFP
jgi:hypothetical protein